MPYIIGVAGGSASGKSTIARSIQQLLPANSSCIISLDNYYRDISWHNKPENEINFDAPESIEIDLFTQHIKSLKQGQQVQIPEYDFSTHCRKKSTITIKPFPVIITEGLFLFNQIQPITLFDFKLFVTAPADIRLMRRLRRDISERGRSLESVLKQYQNFVRPMHKKHVEPNEALAYEIIDTYKNTTEEIATIVRHKFEKQFNRLF